MADEKTVGEMIYDAADGIVANTMSEVQGGVVIKAAFIADVVTPDGTRALVDQYVTDGGNTIATHWDAKGMLSDALAQYDRTRGRSG